MRFFRKQREGLLDDVEFGRINERKSGRWAGQDFELWTYSSIQIIIDAGPDGPTQEQRSFVQSLRKDTRGVRDRSEGAVLQRARETTSKVEQLKLSSIFIPQKPPEQMWRVWYDVVGEEQYSFGAEIVGWNTVTAFVED